MDEQRATDGCSDGRYSVAHIGIYYIVVHFDQRLSGIPQVELFTESADEELRKILSSYKSHVN